ncbi:NAC domain-containing protein 2-like [Rhodamnia argentea]|uniref:NAC domain-containing protein 2-like n=1 Tax=Rhodamnia argentea TaxID=178133 RepID=A0ABM3HPV9_9MYRT|nr:NAC domain-containing protein 2-like [Rhodamnia argentea]
MNGYPIGFRFRPSEDDLFFHYLTKKVEGESEAIPPFMPEVDIYCDEDPWEIFDANSRESFYIFTRLKMIKSRVKRTAGSGTWSNGNKREIMDGQGKVVGYNKLFTFKLSAGNEKMENGRWTMHEYSMYGQENPLSNYS